MNNTERSDAASKGDRGESGVGTSAARQTFEKVFREEEGAAGGAIILTVVVEGGKVVGLRARDAEGRPYQVGFRVLSVGKEGATLLDNHSHEVGGHHGGGHHDDDKDKDKDKDECVKCSGGVCWTVKCGT